MDSKTVFLSALLLVAFLVSLGWGPGAVLALARIPAPPTPPAVVRTLQGEAAELALQDRLVPLLRAREFDEAYRLAVAEAPPQDLDPTTELCAALERAGVRREGALWLQSWFHRSAHEPNFPRQAFAAGVFVSEHLSPRHAIRLLRPLAQQHPHEFGPSAALAMALLQEAAAQGAGDLRDAQQALDRVETLARAEGERSLVHRLRSQVLALQGSSQEALAAHTRLTVATGDRPEFCLEAAVMALRTDRQVEADTWFADAIRAWDSLERDHTERTLPVPDLALASRYALGGRALDLQDLRRLDASRRELEDAGVKGQRALDRMRRFPHLIRKLQDADAAGLQQVVAELDDTERMLVENANNLRCLPYSLHVRPLTRALSHALRGEAYERLGERERSLEQYRRALELFPQAPELQERVRALTAGGPAGSAG